LACIDEEIVQLHSRLKLLKAGRSRLSSDRTQTRAILSPLQRMPPEILGEIFLWTIPALPNRSYSPWFLTHISHRWRQIAVSTSSLWSRVVVHF
ncbi:hypothetical protein B0H12DRAFT_960132, partial [Mycena haematopus]